MNHRHLAVLAVCAATPSMALPQGGDRSVTSLIEPIRVAHHLPALGAALVDENGVVTSGVTGVRKAGTGVAATVNATIRDEWHLGSDTKAMTATIIATLVERGRLKWESTIGEVFPNRSRDFPEAFRRITVAQLLSHHAGLPANIDWRAIEQTRKPLPEQRLDALATAARTPLASAPGTTYLYSNLGYEIAGTMAERVTGKPWEVLMREIVFGPLGMKSCGFHGTGTPGKIDQPWPHTADGKPTGSNGPDVDNAEVMGPAGTVHCSIADWSKFIAEQLRGEHGTGRLLKQETYKVLHTPKFGGDYAFGWLVATRPWAGGTTLTHAGSNTMNFCVVWIAPARNFAVLAVTNQAGGDAEKGTDEAVAALIQMHNK